MSEEEIMSWLQSYLKYPEMDDPKYIKEAIQGLLDLYNKEKDKNKKMFNQYEKRVNELEREIAINSISKDKIREKIKELENLQENQYIHLDYTKKILEELLEENESNENNI